MIVESIVGGGVIALAAVGTCSVCRRLRQRLAYWLHPPQPSVPQPETTLKDPTPSFTVELVRTVLEHQARREDQSRQQLTLLLMQFASTHRCADRAAMSFHDLDEKPLPHRDVNDAGSTGHGMVARTIRRLIPGLR